ncbi:MAG: beta-mannosidase, partial [Prevotella sp.]|nr:beta-mannosidase [Prevotella sp.]
MKKIFLFAFAAMMMTACATKKAANDGKTIANQLEERLASLQQRGYMAGHQDDPFYGVTWEWEYGRSDVKDVTGDYPAVMGFDLGGIEKGDEKNLDSVPFMRIR